MDFGFSEVVWGLRSPLGVFLGFFLEFLFCWFWYWLCCLHCLRCGCICEEVGRNFLQPKMLPFCWRFGLPNSETTVSCTIETLHTSCEDQLSIPERSWWRLSEWRIGAVGESWFLRGFFIGTILFFFGLRVLCFWNYFTLLSIVLRVLCVSKL